MDIEIYQTYKGQLVNQCKDHFSNHNWPEEYLVAKSQARKMEDSRQELHFESFTSVTESYYTYTSPNQSAGPSPTFSRKAGENNYDLTGNNLSIISRGAPSSSLSNSRFSLERTVQSVDLQGTKIESKDSNDEGGIPWKSILFGFLLIAAIVCVTSLIIIVPRNNQVQLGPIRLLNE